MPTRGRPLLEACAIRKDVLEAETGISALAVDIDAILSEGSQTAYDDPSDFFAMTYPTQALVTIATRVFKRITGQLPEVAGIYLLGTALGGGKSHLLASLYHMARAGSKDLPEEFQNALESITFPPVKVAVLTQNSPAGGKKVPRTLWGHLAQQLDAYEPMREYDERMQAPSKEALLELLSGDPVLVLIDEVTNYLIRAAAISVGSRTLAEQTRVFFQALEEVVDLRTNAAVVVSQLTEEFDPLDEGRTLAEASKGLRGPEREEIEARARKEVEVASKILMRKAETQNPVRDDAELVNILRRRIFETTDDEAAKTVAKVYADYYASPGPRGILPSNVADPTVEERISDSYPIHPRTVALLRDKLGQAPKFMQTRGALLLTMQSVRRLWENDSGAMLLHPGHMDPRDPTIRQELAKRVFDDERVDNAIHTELVGTGEEARASLVDATFKADLGSRITTAILLESALVTTRGERDPLVGATQAEILYDVLEPGEDETRVEKALLAVQETSFHIHPVGEKLVFKGDVNLNRFIAERERTIRPHRIEEAVRSRLKSHVLRGSSSFDIHWWPTSPEEIPDGSRLRLAVLPPSDPWWLSKAEATKDLERLFRTKNQAGQAREWRNAVAFLAPSAEQRGRVEEIVRRFLAVREIAQDADFVESLSKEQKSVLDQERAKSQALAILRVGMAYNVLLYPGAKGDFDKPILVGTSLRLTEADIGVDTDTWRVGESRVLVTLRDRLIDEDKWRTDPYSPDFFVQRVFTSRGGGIAASKTYGELIDAFYKDTRLPFLETRDVVKKTVKTGVQDDTWLVASGERVFTSKVSGEAVIHDDSEVVRYNTDRWLELAKDFHLNCGYRKEKCTCPPENGGGNGGDPHCPDCGRPLESCTCEGVFNDVLLPNIPDRAAEWAENRGLAVSNVSVMVNKPGDTAFVLRLLGSLSASGTTVEIDDLYMNIPAVGDIKTETTLRSERPGPLWDLLKGTVEALLAQVTSGKAQGKSNINLIIGFREPLESEDLRRALQPLTMAGGETIKATRIKIHPGRAS